MVVGVNQVSKIPRLTMYRTRGKLALGKAGARG